MEKDDRVQLRIVPNPDKPIKGTVTDTRRDGGYEFARVRFDSDPYGYQPWFSVRQLVPVASAADRTPG